MKNTYYATRLHVSYQASATNINVKPKNSRTNSMYGLSAFIDPVIVGKPSPTHPTKAGK